MPKHVRKGQKHGVISICYQAKFLSQYTNLNKNGHLALHGFYLIQNRWNFLTYQDDPQIDFFKESLYNIWIVPNDAKFKEP